MKKNLFYLFLALCLIFTGCFNENKNDEIEKIDETSLELTFDEEDIIETFNKDDCYIIEFKDTTAIYEKGNLTDSTFEITEKGTYYLTGNFYGNIEIDGKENVRLIFDNLTISSTLNSPIYIKNSKKTIITLAANSTNKIIDSSNYNLDDNSEPNATLFSKDDLVFNGTGTLEIESNYNDAIATKDGLKIVNGVYEINSVGDGIRAKDYILIKDATFNITSKNDGIKTTNEETDMGNLIIENGTFNIDSQADAIDSQNSILIKNGTFDIITDGGSENSNDYNDFRNWGNSSLSQESSKGIKAVSNILIENADIQIDSKDDSIHSNNMIEIKNGNYVISSGDDGIHADKNLKIYNGNIDIKKSYEGLESSDIYIYNGTIYVYSNDDGINVAGGADSSSMGGRPGQNNMSKETGKLQIDNGYIFVDSKGDGLDSNGSIYINDGTIIVNGPTGNGNGSLDYDNEFIINGGSLIAAGSSGMLQTPSLDSKINTIVVTLDTYSESAINVTDSSGNSLITFKPSKQYNSFIYASPNIKINESYNININGNESGENKDGIYQGVYQNGELLENVTINSVITKVGNMKSMGNMNHRPGR